MLGDVPKSSSSFTLISFSDCLSFDFSVKPVLFRVYIFVAHFFIPFILLVVDVVGLLSHKWCQYSQEDK
jgi:hypothetical protein